MLHFKTDISFISRRVTKCRSNAHHHCINVDTYPEYPFGTYSYLKRRNIEKIILPWMYLKYVQIGKY